MSLAFFAASLIVAFLAGVVALAMPCCFSVLLPAYVAKSFDRVRGRLKMTGIFTAGLATILLPIGLGADALTTFLGLNHPLLFMLGGAFMIVLGLLALWGMELLPSARLSVDLERRDVPSVYALGVFSGVASSCCAPVLLGIVVLTSVSGSLLAAGAIGLAYVLGMVFPLLVAATLWDRRERRGAVLFRGRLLSFHLGRAEWEVHSSKLIAGGLFIGMGVVTVLLGTLDRMIAVPGSQLLGIYQVALERALTAALSTPLGQFLLALVVAGGVGAVLLGFVARRRSRVTGGDLRPTAAEVAGNEP